MSIFLVDGDLEQRFLQDVCPGKKVMKIGCNGRDVKSAAIAKRIKTLIGATSSKSPVIVCLDLEGRKMTALEFDEDLRAELHKIGLTQKEVLINVIDRMIENWMLADLAATGLTRKALSSDGFNGKATIKNQIPSYQETTTGVALLKKIRPSVAVQNSPSFSRFSTLVAPHISECWWMKR